MKTRVLFLAMLGAMAFAVAGKAAEPSSKWAHFDAQGKLVYATTERGDRIMDFSFAGYMGGGVKLPEVAAKAIIGPSGADDTTTIQEAINTVSKLPLTDGFRGAVVLKPGNYKCSGALRISTSGVVLRGSGGGTGGTTMVISGRPHACVTINGSHSLDIIGEPSTITDAYVPSGTDLFHVASGADFKVGDTVRISRPVTKDWLHFMGMDQLVRDGKRQNWISGETYTYRVIRKIAGNEITLDLPMTDSFDAKYVSPPGGSMVKCKAAGDISQVGVENLRIVSPPQSVTITSPQYKAITLNGVTDAWLRDIEVMDTINSVVVGGEARRVTVERVKIDHSVETLGAAKPADFTSEGSQVLFNRCSGSGSNLFYFVTGARVAGPIVLLNCTFHGDGHIQPHARWATGLLVDGCQVPESGIDLMNRGVMGSGHGWTIGWAVAWNCVAKTYQIQQPPGAMNWAIGCIGEEVPAAMPFGDAPLLPEGTMDSPGKPVLPTSLYLAQLRERLGAEAVKNIGY